MSTIFKLQDEKLALFKVRVGLRIINTLRIQSCGQSIVLYWNTDVIIVNSLTAYLAGWNDFKVYLLEYFAFTCFIMIKLPSVWDISSLPLPLSVDFMKMADPFCILLGFVQMCLAFCRQYRKKLLFNNSQENIDYKKEHAKCRKWQKGIGTLETTAWPRSGQGRKSPGESSVGRDG